MTEPPPAAAGDAFHAKTVRAVAWMTLFQLGRAGLFFAMPVVLARTGTVRDVGLGELVLAVFFVLMPLVELGTGASVIQRRSLDRAFLDTVFFSNVCLGAAVSLALWAGAGPLTAALGLDDRLPPLLVPLAPALFGVALAVVPQALLARQMAFGAITGVNAVAIAAGAGAGVWAVSRQAGAGAIGVALFTYVAVNTIGVSLAARWRPGTAISAGALAAIWRFSGPAAAARFVGTLAAHLERFLIGAVLGSASLGIYGAARNLARTPFLQIMNVSDRVLLPALSRLQHDLAATRACYRAAVSYELALLGPFVVFAGALSPDLVVLLYGDGWSRVAPLAAIVAFITLRTITNHTTGAVLLAQGRPGLQLAWSAASIPLVTLYVALGRAWDVEGVLVAWAVVGLAGWTLPHLLVGRVIGWRFADFLRSLVPVGTALASWAALLVAVRTVIPPAAGPLGRFVLLSILGLPAYAALLWWRAPHVAAGIVAAGTRGWMLPAERDEDEGVTAAADRR